MRRILKKVAAVTMALVIGMAVLPISPLNKPVEAKAAEITIAGGTYTYSVKEDNTIEIVGWEGTDTKITIPSTIDGMSVTSIGSDAFYGCSSLTDITIPEGVTSIDRYAFGGCSGLTSITIPEGVISIGNSAFAKCRGLTTVTMPRSLEIIEHSAFYGCSSLTSITIPEGITSEYIKYAFGECKSLIDINVSNNNQKYASVSGVLFSKDCTELIRCPEGKIGAYVIPEGVTRIGDNAFSNCTGLTDITIPKGVKNIENAAFTGCSGLTSITIPESVTSMEKFSPSTFVGCSSLISINVSANNPK